MAKNLAQLFEEVCNKYGVADLEYFSSEDEVPYKAVCRIIDLESLAKFLDEFGKRAAQLRSLAAPELIILTNDRLPDDNSISLKITLDVMHGWGRPSEPVFKVWIDATIYSDSSKSDELNWQRITQIDTNKAKISGRIKAHIDYEGRCSGEISFTANSSELGSKTMNILNAIIMEAERDLSIADRAFDRCSIVFEKEMERLMNQLKSR